MRCRGRARSPEREGARDGLLPDLQPEPRGGELREDRSHHGRLPAGRAADQPYDPGALSAGLDLQGRDDRRGARVEPLPAGLVVLRPGVLHGLREARQQLRHRGAVREPDTRPRPPALRELGVLQHRQGARRQADPRAGEEVRLLRAPAARDARGRAVPERPVSQPRPLVPEARPGRRRGPDGVRARAHARDADADGDGRGRDRQRRHRDASVGRRQGRLPAGEDRLPHDVANA